MNQQQHLAPMDQAILLAGHAVSYATAYLDGRNNPAQLADNSNRLFLDMLVVETTETASFLIPVQLLAISMMQTARYGLTEERRERWHAVMGSLVDLILHETRKLAKD